MALFIGGLFVASPPEAIRYPESNRPDLIKPLYDLFIVEARARGLQVDENLANLISINIVENPRYLGQDSNGITWEQNGRFRIELRRASMETEGAAIRVLFHELGHVFGLEDCCGCTYNFMRCQENQRANMLFKDIKLREVFFDVYFEAISNPRRYNGAHNHY